MKNKKLKKLHRLTSAERKRIEKISKFSLNRLAGSFESVIKVAISEIIKLFLMKLLFLIQKKS